MYHTYRKIGFFLLFVIGVVTLPAQEQFKYSKEADSVFAEGLSLYTAGSFEQAAALFEDGLNINPIHQRTTACYLMAAKSWLRLREETRAMFLLNNFLKRFPESGYTRDAHFTLGTTYFLLENTPAAVKEFLSIILQEKDDALSVRAKNVVDSLVNFVLTPSEANQIASETNDSYFQAARSRKPTESVAENSKKKDPPPQVKQKSKFVTLGVMLPLMENSSPSPVKKAAEELLDGIMAAKNEFERTSGEFGINLDVRDTKRDSLLDKQAIDELAAKKEILAVIGPLFSNSVQACAPIANAKSLPLIAPMANAKGIAATGTYIFQANTDISMHGKALAQYAVQQLGLTTLAVVAPNTPVMKILTSEFIAEAKKLGATISAHEYYESIGGDLKPQFQSLRKSASQAEPQVSFERNIDKTQRKKILAAGVSEAVLDSLLDGRAKISVSKLFGKNGLRTAESIRLKIITPKSPSLNTEIPVTTIQGIFAPVLSAEDLGVIASQMTYYNIRTQLLGSAEWYDEAQLQSQKRYTDGAIFCSDYYLDEEDSVFISLQQQLKKRPTKYTLFGYDAMKLVCSCIERGTNSRDRLRDCMNTIEFWEGLHSSVTLSKGRVNNIVQILQFRDGEVKRVTEVTVD